MDLSKLTMTDKILAGTGLALVIDLLFLPWHSIDLGFTTFSLTGVEERNAFLGVLALLLAAAVAAVTLIRALKPETKLPELPITWDKAISFAAFGTAGLLVLKLLLETDFLGFGAYLGILLGAGMAYGGFQKQKETAAV